MPTRKITKLTVKYSIKSVKFERYVIYQLLIVQFYGFRTILFSRGPIVSFRLILAYSTNLEVLDVRMKMFAKKHTRK